MDMFQRYPQDVSCTFFYLWHAFSTSQNAWKYLRKETALSNEYKKLIIIFRYDSNPSSLWYIQWILYTYYIEKPLHNFLGLQTMLLFDDNRVKMARKPGKKQKENPVGCTGERKRWKGNIKEGSSREGNTGTAIELKWTLWEDMAQHLEQSSFPASIVH